MPEDPSTRPRTSRNQFPIGVAAAGSHTTGPSRYLLRGLHDSRIRPLLRRVDPGHQTEPVANPLGQQQLANILFLDEVDEHVDYDAAMASGKNLAVAVVALSGIAVNALLYLVFRFAAPWWRTITRRLVAYSTCWLLCMEVGNFFCYVPIRVASPSGDMHNWTVGSHQSWWWLYVIIGYLTLWAMIDFYRTVMPTSLDASGIGIRVGQGGGVGDGHAHPVRLLRRPRFDERS